MKISNNIPTGDLDFFRLLRAGLWQSVNEPLSETPDWTYIYRLACEQTVQGIMADGIALYKAEYPDIQKNMQGYDEFLNQCAQIIRQNYKVNHVQAKVCGMLEAAAIDYVVIKGQGVAQCYSKPMLRCSGDIDLFFSEQNYERAKQLLKPLSAAVEDKPLTLECALAIGEVDIELHGAMTSGINKAADAHLQTILRKVISEDDTRSIAIGTCEITLPSANFDAIYILTHTIRHLGAFGISLRQVIDWTMHMHAAGSLIDRARLQSDVEAMHLGKLWRLFSRFAVEYLGAPEEDFALCGENSNGKAEPSDETGKLWQLIRVSGSFGHKNPYFAHLHAGRLNERLARIYYHIRQALKLRSFDREFSSFLLRKEIKDTLEAPFRFLFGRKTKITE